jgi:hypothetical protein
VSLTVDGDEQLADTTNLLGVCPFVLGRHSRRPDEFFGRHAYDGSERPLLLQLGAEPTGRGDGTGHKRNRVHGGRR